jgi:hypothetical protein
MTRIIHDIYGSDSTTQPSLEQGEACPQSAPTS